MAGRGPAPKAPEDRRNKTSPQRGEWVTLQPLSEPVLPAQLPKRAKGAGGWSARTKRLYSGWRQDPVTATYGENEKAAVVELAFLQEELARGELKLAAEVRQRLDGLGLTMKGKRDLRFRVAEPDTEEAPKPPARRRASARRAHLQAVR